MTTPQPDLVRLLHDAVDGIEPTDRIEAIRARTVSARPGRRRAWYAAGGVALAAAAAVTAFAVLEDPAPTHDQGTVTTPTVETRPVTAYFLGRTPLGFRLYLELDDVPADDPLGGALARIQRPPTDPDYQTLWPAGSLVSAEVAHRTIEVELADNAPSTFAGAVEGLPEQQVVYTLQAAVGQRLPVQFLRHGTPVGAPVTARPQADVLSRVLISTPGEGLAVHGGFTAHGLASSFEANVPWEVRDEKGRVVARGAATAAGSGARLSPWSARIDVRDLPDGFYTFVAMQDDPSGGEGPGPDSDTRTIIVR